MRKFFVDEESIQGDIIYIHGDDRKHIVDVLRMKLGDDMIITCGNINYVSVIDKFEDDRIILKIIETKEGENEPNIEICLFQGLAKGDKMDYIVQKCTEIGVKEFYGVEMARSVVKVKNQKWIDSRVDRLNKIAEEASKQCKRDYIPKFKDIVSFKVMLDILSKEDNIIVPYESENDNEIKSVLLGIEGTKVNIVIGPEGGFSESEIDELKSIGAKSVSLSNRILRTETAGLVASVITLYELGNIGVI